jgi:hypothetical protein
LYIVQNKIGLKCIFLLSLSVFNKNKIRKKP